MQYSHSRIETFNKCQFQFKLRYLDNLETLPDDTADNALYLGTALHTGIQVGVDEAIKEYYSNYPIISDEIITEAMKLEVMIQKARYVVPANGKAEVELNTHDFKGFIDWLVPTEKQYHFDLYDFKYTNNEQNYMDSDQLHLYKYFFEKTHPGQYIRNMYFLFVPKSKLKRGKDEDLEQYRKRIMNEIVEIQPYLRHVEYRPEKVIEYMISIKHCIETTEYCKNPQFLCKFCEYRRYCQSDGEEDWDIIYPNERR